MTNNSNIEYRLCTANGVHTIVAIDPTSQLWIEYALDGRQIANGAGTPPTGTHATTDPVSAAIGHLQAGIRAEKSETRREVNNAGRLANELAHTKAIAGGVQNSLRDQLALTRDDRDDLLVRLLDVHKEAADDLVEIRVEKELALRALQDEERRAASLRNGCDAIRNELVNIVVQFDDYRGGDHVAELSVDRLLSIIHSEIDELQHQRDGAADRANRSDESEKQAAARIETLAAEFDALAARNARQHAGIAEIATALNVPADGEGRYVLEEIAAAARRADAHRVSLNETHAELNEIAIELGIELAEDDAETPEILDRVRTLVGDHKAFERRVEQLSEANVALRKATGAAPSFGQIVAGTFPTSGLAAAQLDQAKRDTTNEGSDK